MAVILSDIAASTLGVVLFLYPVMQAAIQAQDPAEPAPAPYREDLGASFKVLKAPPLSARQMVEALHARGGHAEGDFTFVDVFPDRLEIAASSGGNGVEKRATVVRREVFPAARLNGVLRETAEGGTFVFVFSNQMFNLLLGEEFTGGEAVRFVNVPSALIETGPEGRLSWSGSMRQLFQNGRTYPEFRLGLARLLGGGETEDASSIGASGNGTVAQDRIVPRHMDLAEGAAQFAEACAVAFLALVSGLVIWWTERKF